MRTDKVIQNICSNTFSKSLSSFLKGFAILLILICHIGNHFTRFTTPLGGIGVAIFLFLSGYGLTCSLYNSGNKKFWRKRIIAVFLPYILIQLVTFALHPYKNFSMLILDWTLIEPLMPMSWFLNYLLIWYIAFWITSFASNKNTRTIILGFFTIALCCITYYFHQFIRFEQSFSFFLGYIIATYDMKSFLIGRIGIISFVIGIILLGIKQISVIHSYLVVDLPIKIFFLWTILACAREYSAYLPSILQKKIMYIGAISFEIYLIQSYMCDLFKLSYSKILLGMVVFIGCLFIAIVFNWVIKYIRPKVSRGLSI